MTLEEAIITYTCNAEYERTHGNILGCLEFRQLADWLRKYQKIQEIVTKWQNESKMKFATSYYNMAKITEVVEDGNERTM